MAVDEGEEAVVIFHPQFQRLKSVYIGDREWDADVRRGVVAEHQRGEAIGGAGRGQRINFQRVDENAEGASGGISPARDDDSAGFARDGEGALPCSCRRCATRAWTDSKKSFGVEPARDRAASV